MERAIIPDVIDGRQPLCCLGTAATAHEAAILMRERRVGAVMVMDDGRLVGIVTERDLVYRVIAQELDPHATALDAIMTSGPDTLAPDDTAADALEKMRLGHFRHLPVVEGRDVRGMVSIRDLYEVTRRALEAELRGAETLIYGEQYGSAGDTPH